MSRESRVGPLTESDKTLFEREKILDRSYVVRIADGLEHKTCVDYVLTLSQSQIRLSQSQMR